jgi:two-component system, cell cycle sensor histidine kinase and response regulator CckA
MSEAVRILLVDDEPLLLRLMKTYLKKLGYVVEGCADGKSAIEEFDRASGAFDLLVADLTLPDTSGQDLAVELARKNKNLRVLLCSGYPVQLQLVPDDIRSRFGALDKPFPPDMLVSSIQKLLRRVK